MTVEMERKSAYVSLRSPNLRNSRIMPAVVERNLAADIVGPHVVIWHRLTPRLSRFYHTV